MMFRCIAQQVMPPSPDPGSLQRGNERHRSYDQIGAVVIGRKRTRSTVFIVGTERNHQHTVHTGNDGWTGERTFHIHGNGIGYLTITGQRGHGDQVDRIRLFDYSEHVF